MSAPWGLAASKDKIAYQADQYRGELRRLSHLHCAHVLLFGSDKWGRKKDELVAIRRGKKDDRHGFLLPNATLTSPSSKRSHRSDDRRHRLFFRPRVE